MRRFVLSMLAIASLTAASWAATTTAPAFGANSTEAPPADALKVDYFANANTAGAPDGTARLTNPGTPGGNVCAYITVFDSNQEMSECCGCLLTPDGLATLSVNTDLTSNPLTGVTLSTGAIKIFSVAPVNNTCPLPGTSRAAQPFESGGVRAWVTHIQNSNFSETETGSQDATLSDAESFRVYNECAAIVLDGSGHGVCTCGTGE
jgi:hypothetical protein